MELAKAYEPKEHEDGIYKEWEDSGFFAPENLPGERTEPFTISLPPPNATGKLHMGHATMLAIEDLMIRFERMRGKKALWVPGLDHAAIATQNVVEKELWKTEKKTRHDIGRDALLERIHAFVAESKKTIEGQMRKMGASCDWSRQRYTMDDGLSRAVRTMFVRMYEDGLIYRGNRIVNWCSRCQTTLADDEVTYKEEKGKFYYFKYGPVTIGTARPETKFQDKTLVVHPEDERYRDLVGTTFSVPWIEDAPLTSNVIADPIIDRTFGTGAMTITPAHSFEDFDLATRHQLPIVTIIDEAGNLTDAAGTFAGRNAREAREDIVAVLEKKGLVEKVDENYVHNLSVCYRCDTPIEPLPKLQWFIAVDKKPKNGGAALKEKSLAVVRDQSVTIIPDRFEKTYYHWMENLRDWCVSRQIWFGHRIPVWYKKSKGADDVYVGIEPPKDDGWEQDPDTLDTWFSAGLWTFSTLGWPDNTVDLKTYHPTSVLETGYDILFFWVARMILMTTYALSDVPFKNVYLHGLVRDKQGRKMSKSLGNGIDPLDVIAKYGADAVRLSLLIGATPGNDVRLFDEKIAGFRNLVNKLWNIGRFILAQATGDRRQVTETAQESEAWSIADEWILARFETVRAQVTKDLEEYRFSQAGETLREFTWNDFADWYVEVKKVEGDAQGLLRTMFMDLLKLWHPFTPFVTEALWKAFGGDGLIMVAGWPQVRPTTSSDAGLPAGDLPQGDRGRGDAFTQFQNIVTAIRAARATYRIAPTRALEAVIDAPDTAALASLEPSLKRLARLQTVTFGHGLPRPAQSIASTVAGAMVFLPVGAILNWEEEQARITADVETQKRYIASIETRLTNDQFVQNAAPEIVAETRAKCAAAKEELARLISFLS